MAGRNKYHDGKPTYPSSNLSDLGVEMHGWASDLFPVCRSITGEGVRITLRYLQHLLPDLQIHCVPSGTKCFDWTVPEEWNIRDAYILDQSGSRLIDFRKNNLHVIGYSEPIDRELDLVELNEHLYSLPNEPNAIPYVTSYYERRWGFCLTQNQREQMTPGRYRAVIDSELRPGELNYGEIILPGASDEEIFLSTYVCHPSLANDQLSGPVVTAALARWLLSLNNRRYTYRLVFLPETIGSIVYLSRHLDSLKANVIAGFNVANVGDNRAYSYLPSRAGNTLADRVALHVLKYADPNFRRYSWLDRGSDERQYCAPGVDLPIASIMRTKFGSYPEYHNSLDDLELVTPEGLAGGFEVLRNAISTLEGNRTPRVTTLGEPFLARHNLKPTLSNYTSLSGPPINTKRLVNLLTYSDGNKDLIEIGELIGAPAASLAEIVQTLLDCGLIEI